MTVKNKHTGEEMNLKIPKAISISVFTFMLMVVSGIAWIKYDTWVNTYEHINYGKQCDYQKKFNKGVVNCFYDLDKNLYRYIDDDNATRGGGSGFSTSMKYRHLKP